MTDRVEVRDSVNPNRLLGYILKADLPHSSEYIRIAFYRPFTPLTMPPPCTIQVDYVELRREWKQTDGWEAVAILKTSASLGDLMRIRGFRLPEEDEHQAYRRQA